MSSSSLAPALKPRQSGAKGDCPFAPHAVHGAVRSARSSRFVCLMTLTLRYWFKHFRCIYNKGALWNTTCPSSADRPCSRTSSRRPHAHAAVPGRGSARSPKAPTTLFRVGDRTTAMGIMLEGPVRLEKEDYWGNPRSILASFGPGQSFAEVEYACGPGPGLRHQRGGSRRRDRAVPGHRARDHHSARRRARSTPGSSATCWASWRSAPTR